jgi:hypothetical protein
MNFLNLFTKLWSAAAGVAEAERLLDFDRLLFQNDRRLRLRIQLLIFKNGRAYFCAEFFCPVHPGNARNLSLRPSRFLGLFAAIYSRSSS